MSRIRRCGLLLAVWIVALSAAQDGVAGTEDGGGWFMLAGSGSFEAIDPGLSRLRWWFDGQLRALDDSNGYDQLLLRPGLGLELGRGFSLWQGYVYVDTDPRRRSSFREHRSWQQLLWKGSLEGLGLQSRTRLEQRFVDGDGEAGWRFRQLVKGAHALDSAGRWGVAAYEEVFFELNDTSNGADTGFAQNRFFIGPFVRLGSGRLATVEFGYLNQYIRRDGGRDTSNHLASLNLLFSLP